jgi:hypothetical protein
MFMNSLALPPLYRRWADAILKQDVYSEPRATCDDCAMCAYIQPAAKQDYYFLSNVKCCGYHPVLPNYLVGAILADDDPNLNEVKENFLQRVIRSAITPLGISPTYWVNLNYKLKKFGKHGELLCPYYLPRDGGKCGIWKYRNATCSTFFCKHERGATGWRFWNQLSVMLFSVENILSQYCVDKLQVIIPESASDIRERTWGNWTFREVEFYQSCWDMVRPLSWDEVVKICGTELESSVEQLKSKFNATQSKVLPESLKMNYVKSEEVAGGLTRVWAYSNYNPIDLPTNLIEALEYFDGRPVWEVLDQIKQEKALSIDSDLLLKLTDYELLKPTP